MAAWRSRYRTSGTSSRRTRSYKANSRKDRKEAENEGVLQAAGFKVRNFIVAVAALISEVLKPLRGHGSVVLKDFWVAKQREWGGDR